MNTLSMLLAAAGAALLVACGGGSSAPPVVSMFGDSINSGTYSRADGTVGRWSPTPVQRVQELVGTRMQIEDASIPGMRAHDAITGGYGWKGSKFGLTDIPQNPPFETYLKTSANTIVLRYGTADALLQTSPEAFRSDLTQLVQAAKAAGKRVVLIEPIHQPPEATLADPLSLVVHEVAQAESVQLILVRDLLWTLIDGIHPDQATAYLLAARIAQFLSQETL